jgi:hypothetical protein
MPPTNGSGSSFSIGFCAWKHSKRRNMTSKLSPALFVYCSPSRSPGRKRLTATMLLSSSVTFHSRFLAPRRCKSSGSSALLRIRRRKGCISADRRVGCPVCDGSLGSRDLVLPSTLGSAHRASNNLNRLARSGHVTEAGTEPDRLEQLEQT